ncbi:hypothetical protein [Chitinophaga sp. 212800010-3]|uniref:hypothetical protein n=1 Tax=unclassified Chitinophaga TaxID=2619133 RepID=UPI002DE76D8B|nr:DNA-binding protein [Chitinophaga sp. 212800010-3]
MNHDIYGIDKEHAHPRALALLPEEFFWDCMDELAPFGSEAGETALVGFRDWRNTHGNAPMMQRMKEVIESVGKIELSEYTEALTDRDLLIRQKEDPAFDDEQCIFTLDTSIIATAFGQLVDEGTIDADIKPLVLIAIERQIAWAQLSESWSYAEQHIGYLNILSGVLEQA